MTVEELFNSEPFGELPKIAVGDFITRAKDFIATANNLYWQNWGWRVLNDDELPEENTCDKCEGSCVITLDGQEYDCVPNHADGVCTIRVFDTECYAADMSELMDKLDHLELLEFEIDFSAVNEPEITVEQECGKPLHEL